MTRLMRSLGVGALLAAMVLPAGAQTTGERVRATADRAQAQMGDAWITTKIQAQYFLDADVKARNIDVTTANAIVTLTGIVHSDRERQQAVSIARNTDGVKNVVDKLTVRPEAGTTGKTGTRTEPPARVPGEDELARVAESEAMILTQIKAKFALDPLVNALAIDVDVDDGMVTLTGEVKDQAAHARALEIARSVKGVKGVKDQLKIK